MAYEFDYTSALRQATAPIRLLTQLNLQERAERQALQEEARRRAERMADIERQEERADRRSKEEREFAKERDEAARKFILERDEAQEVNRRQLAIMARNQVIDDRRYVAKLNSEMEKDHREWTLDDDKQAVKLMGAKYQNLIRERARQLPEILEAINKEDPELKRKFTERMLSDPTVLKELKAKQIAGLRNGTIKWSDLDKDTLEDVSLQYTTHLKELTAQSQAKAALRGGVLLREFESKQNELMAAIQGLQKVLPPGVIADETAAAFKGGQAGAATSPSGDPLDAFAGDLTGGAAPPAAAPTAGPAPVVDVPVSEPATGLLPTVGRGVAGGVAKAASLLGGWVAAPVADVAGSAYRFLWSGGQPSGPAQPVNPALNPMLGTVSPQMPAAPSLSPMQSRVQMGQVKQSQEQLFGTSDRAYLKRVTDWYKQKTGATQQDIDALVQAAAKGDPAAQAQIRQVMAQARREVPQEGMAAPYPVFSPSPQPNYPDRNVPAYVPAR